MRQAGRGLLSNREAIAGRAKDHPIGFAQVLERANGDVLLLLAYLAQVGVFLRLTVPQGSRLTGLIDFATLVSIRWCVTAKPAIWSRNQRRGNRRNCLALLCDLSPNSR